METPTEAPSRVTSAAAFKKAAQGVELTLPSGYTVLAKRIDIRALMKTGKIPNSLRPVLDRAMQGKETPTEDLAKDLMGDEKKLEELFSFMDQVFVDCIVEPRCAIRPVGLDQEEYRNAVNRILGQRNLRSEEDIVWTDEVSDPDKQYVMNWAMGGSSDLERFREESNAHVERVHSVTGVWDPPQ